MVLGSAGASYNLDDSKARAYCTCSRCGWGIVWTFLLSAVLSPLSPSFWETARYRLKYCLKGPLNPNQPTNQIHQRNQYGGQKSSSSPISNRCQLTSLNVTKTIISGMSFCNIVTVISVSCSQQNISIPCPSRHQINDTIFPGVFSRLVVVPGLNSHWERR